MTSEQRDPWIRQAIGQSGRYLIETFLGQGSMGRVYKALDTKLSVGDHQVYRAIKLMNIDLAASSHGRERFRREMQACVILQDPHIVNVFDYGVVVTQRDSNQVLELPFTVMEWVQGPTLDSVLNQVGPLPVTQGIGLACQMATGLNIIHKGITVQGRTVRFIHRDLKPANIFLISEGHQDKVKIADFGFVKFLGDLDLAPLTQTGQYGGTPSYSSPEQIQGSKEVDGRSDIYSLGCILYRMLSNSNPFKLDAQAGVIHWMAAHLKQKPQPFDPSLNIPKPIESLILRCLQKDPVNRFSTAAELESTLLAIQAKLGLTDVKPIALRSNSSDSSQLLPLAIQPSVASSSTQTADSSVDKAVESNSPVDRSHLYEKALETLLAAFNLKLQVFKQADWLNLTLIQESEQLLDQMLLKDEIKRQLEKTPNLDVTQVRLGCRTYGSAQLNWKVEFELTPVIPDELPVDEEMTDYQAQPTYIPSTELVAVEMKEFLESSLPDSQLRLQLRQRDETLTIVINHPTGHTFDFDVIARRLAFQIQSIQMPGVQRLDIYSRVFGTRIRGHETHLNLADLSPNISRISESSTPSEEIEKSTVEAEIPAIAPTPDTPTLQVKSTKTAEIKLNELKALDELDLSQYQFIRNKNLLTTTLPTPEPAIAQLVLFFHDLDESNKRQLLPVLEQFFKDPSKVSHDHLSTRSQEWLNDITNLSDQKFKTVAVWLSRYCKDPHRALNEVSVNLKAVMEKAQTATPDFQIHSDDSIDSSVAEISSDQAILYRASSHWITSLWPIFHIVISLISLMLLVPSSLSNSLLVAIGLAALPGWILSLASLVTIFAMARALLHHKSYCISVTQSKLIITEKRLPFKEFISEVSLESISGNIKIQFDGLGQLLNYGSLSIQGKKIEPRLLTALSSPEDLKNQIQYLKQQQIFGRQSQLDRSKGYREESGADVGPGNERVFGEDNRYRLEVIIGQGGMGRVYRAMDRKLSIYVAVKFMLHGAAANSEAVERFQREMQACLSLQDPRIVKVLDYGFTGEELRGMESVPYLVMEYVAAPTLADILHRVKRFEIDRAVNIAFQIAAALHTVHSGVLLKGKRIQFIHRDLKPSNIFLIKTSDESETIKLADFGLVKFQGEISLDTLSETGEFRGTVNFAAPEQCEGRRTIDTRADIYSLGCILYEMLSGTNPYGLPSTATLPQWLYAHVYAKPQPFPKSLSISPQLESVVMRCLAKEPNTRFSTTLELQTMLAGILGSI